MDTPEPTCIHRLRALGQVQHVRRVQSLWGGVGEILSCTLDGRAVIVKSVQAAAQGDRGHRRKLRSYEVELHWYRAYRPRVRVARAVHLEPGLFVLEDLDAAGFAGRARQLDVKGLRACIDWLAAFHRQYLGVPPEGLWPTGTYWHLQTRPDELARMPPGPLKEAAADLDALFRACPVQTLVHGDAKPANFCFSAHEGVAAVDFQYVGGGVGIRDLVYLLGSLSERRLSAEYDSSVDRYFEQLEHPEAESAWRPLLDVAWADFQRFLDGWAPGRGSAFAAERTARAVSGLRSR